MLGAADIAPGEPSLVSVRRGCGSVEVRVSGPLATLTLFFDSAGLQWSDIRCAVRTALARYRSSLLRDPGVRRAIREESERDAGDRRPRARADREATDCDLFSAIGRALARARRAIRDGAGRREALRMGSAVSVS